VATSAAVDIGQFIYSRPDFRNGRPCIAGTGMSVRAVASRYLRGETAEEIADDLDDIPRSHIYAALAYYFANREAIDADLAADLAEYQRLIAESRRVQESDAPASDMSAAPRHAAH
jgi:uncharacterized protein (DUF433 family)